MDRQSSHIRQGLVLVLLTGVLAACGGEGESPGGGGLSPTSTLPPTGDVGQQHGGLAACPPGVEVSGDIQPGTTSAPECGSSKYTLFSNVAYASGGSHLLDLYVPKTGTAPFKTVIWVHGGGWKSGDKTNVNQAKHLVCRGYALASINYRLSDEAKFPAQIHDVKAAIRFLRANAGRYGLNPQRFALFGSSAGGHLAALGGTSGGVADLEDLTMGNAGFSSRVQAVVDWYGPTDFKQMDTQLRDQGCSTGGHSSPTSGESLLLGCTVGDAACASAVSRANPVTYANAGDPPTLLMHGTADCVVPGAQSGLLRDALSAAGTCNAFRPVLGAGHGTPHWLTAPVQEPVAAFLDAVLASPGLTPPP
ncbi:alpha/beta hydrolase [Stigmatella aurantiaca]|nr:alpha/beta hydrolase [Stigmatella aurantiaca]EAU69975.1 esterase/lipase/thioesterase [Stigmatella aurantiaca DW4/3-1]